jgi:toxin FitB
MKMTGTKLIDSSVWVEYLVEGRYHELIEEDQGSFLLSTLSIFEIKKRLMKKVKSILEINKGINFVKQKSIIIPITEEIAEKAVKISVENKMPMADSLIYQTALENDASVITLDNHFRELKNAEVLEI